jgi:hypothetical protein
MGLDGPSRTIKVEPVRIAPAPAEPARERPERETTPAAPEREKEKV